MSTVAGCASEPTRTMQSPFERWLTLFRETAEETCPGEGAAHVITAAERIARSLHMAVEGAARPVPPVQ